MVRKFPIRPKTDTDFPSSVGTRNIPKMMGNKHCVNTANYSSSLSAHINIDDVNVFM